MGRVNDLNKTVVAFKLAHEESECSLFRKLHLVRLDTAERMTTQEDIDLICILRTALAFHARGVVLECV